MFGCFHKETPLGVKNLVPKSIGLTYKMNLLYCHPYAPFAMQNAPFSEPVPQALATSHPSQTLRQVKNMLLRGCENLKSLAFFLSDASETPKPIRKMLSDASETPKPTRNMLSDASETSKPIRNIVSDASETSKPTKIIVSDTSETPKLTLSECSEGFNRRKCYENQQH
jgi:hypothetical protein